MNGEQPPLWLIPLSHQRGYFADQNWQFRLHDSPDNPVIHLRVGVNQNVAEGNDAVKLGDPGGECGIQARELRKGFANDGKGALDGKPQHGVP